MAAYSHLSPSELDDQQWRRVVALRVRDSGGGIDFGKDDVCCLLASHEGRAAWLRHVCKACSWSGRNDDGSTCRSCYGSRLHEDTSDRDWSTDPDGPDGPALGLSLAPRGER
jgi:hypothetical protein